MFLRVVAFTHISGYFVMTPSRWVKPSVKTIGLEYVWVHSMCWFIQTTQMEDQGLRSEALRKWGVPNTGVPRWRRCGPRLLG